MPEICKDCLLVNSSRPYLSLLCVVRVECYIAVEEGASTAGAAHQWTQPVQKLCKDRPFCLKPAVSIDSNRHDAGTNSALAKSPRTDPRKTCGPHRRAATHCRQVGAWLECAKGRVSSGVG